jgi:hypothetical protein
MVFDNVEGKKLAWKVQEDLLAVSEEDLRCGLCDVSFSWPEQLQQHQDGKRHTKKERESYHRAVLHCASQRTANLSPPLPGTLREAATASCMKLLRIAATGRQEQQIPILSTSEQRHNTGQKEHKQHLDGTRPNMKKRWAYRRSVMHHALKNAAHLSLPLPGTLRAAATASCEKLLRIAATDTNLQAASSAPRYK